MPMGAELSTASSRVGTIDAIYCPVERFLERSSPTPDGPGPLSPLDAYLVHLVAEFCPRPAFVADLACVATAGASSLVCLANPGVSRVAPVEPDAEAGLRAADLAIRLAEFADTEFNADRSRAILSLDRTDCPLPAIEAALSPHEQPLFLIDVSGPDGEGAPTFVEILDRFPDALVLALGVGKTGECEAVRRLLLECHAGSSHRLWLLREAASSLLESRLALIARSDSPSAEPIARRIGQLFTTNFDFLTLLRDSCQYAIERGAAERLDREIQELHARIKDLQGEVDRRDQEIMRLEAYAEGLRAHAGRVEAHAERVEAHAARLQAHAEELEAHAEGLQLQLDCEVRRPVLKALILQCGRRTLAFGRKYRAFLAPEDSHRERIVKTVMRLQRGLRGRAA